MSKTLIVPAATPYAEALLLSGDEKVEKDMVKILDILKEVEPLEDYFVSPKISATTKKEFTKKIFEKQISSVSLNFLLLLIDRRRINILSSIIEKYLELRNNECNEVMNMNFFIFFPAVTAPPRQLRRGCQARVGGCQCHWAPSASIRRSSSPIRSRLRRWADTAE